MNYQLINTYHTTPHAVSGSPQTEPCGKKKETRETIKTRSSRDKWRTAKENEINTITDSIEIFSRNELRTLKRKNKNHGK